MEEETRSDWVAVGGVWRRAWFGSGLWWRLLLSWLEVVAEYSEGGGGGGGGSGEAFIQPSNKMENCRICCRSGCG